MNIIESVIAIIAPHECLGCGAEGLPLCTACCAALPRRPDCCYRCGRTDGGNKVCAPCRRRTSLFQLTSVTAYEEVAKELVWSLKFDRRQAAAISIGNAVADTLQTANTKDVILTHVPTAAERIRLRGYDQAELITRAVGRRLHLPHASLLARMGRQRQVGEQRKTRFQQMQHAFRPVRQETIVNRHILIIDDVITTGATLEAAAQVLKQAGARRVSAAVFAVA